MNTLSLAPRTELSYTLKTRHCVGKTINSEHHACPNDKAPYCYAHDDLWQCAMCRGNCNKPLKTCEEEHAIYLAAFAPDTFKVGVTRSWRLETRLKEQGADRAAHIRTVADGRLARQIEADIAEDLVDRVRVPTKIETMHQSVNRIAWNNLLEDFEVLEEFDFEYGFNLEQQPITGTFLSGTIYGTQGRRLLLERSGSVYAIDMRDLLGYDISEENDTEELQSSFTAFD